MSLDPAFDGTSRLEAETKNARCTEEKIRKGVERSRSGEGGTVELRTGAGLVLDSGQGSWPSWVVERERATTAQRLLPVMDEVSLIRLCLR
jgi:hypothetical protein